MAFGQASDMAPFGPNAQLTAIVDDWNPYYIRRVKALLDGTWKTGDVWDGIAQGTVVLAPWSPKIPADVVKLAEAARDNIAKGVLHPFTGRSSARTAASGSRTARRRATRTCSP